MTPATVLEHDGIQQPIEEWALDYGITPNIIIARIERGASAADAITKPMKTGYRGQRLPIFSADQVAKQPNMKPGRRSETYSVNGISKTIVEWAAHLGISKASLFHRRNKLGSMEAAIAYQPVGRWAKQPTPGVVADLSASLGTGAGSTARESAHIDFSSEG